MLKTKTLLIIIVIIVIAVLIILAIVFGSGIKKQGEGPPETEEPPLLEEIYGLSGKITAINENAFWIDAVILFVDGTSKKEPRKVLVDENTKIIKLEFPKKITPEDRTKPIIPQETEINFSDLKIGDKIDAASQKNIQGKTEFLAKTINVIY